MGRSGQTRTDGSLPGPARKEGLGCHTRSSFTGTRKELVQLSALKVHEFHIREFYYNRVPNFVIQCLVAATASSGVVDTSF